MGPPLESRERREIRIKPLERASTVLHRVSHPGLDREYRAHVGDTSRVAEDVIDLESDDDGPGPGPGPGAAAAPEATSLGAPSASRKRVAAPEAVDASQGGSGSKRRRSCLDRLRDTLASDLASPFSDVFDVTFGVAKG